MTVNQNNFIVNAWKQYFNDENDANVKESGYQIIKKRKEESDKILSQVYETPWFKERPQKVQETYKKHKLTNFYKSKDLTRCRRIYGVIEADDEVFLHAISALILLNNIVEVPLDDVVECDMWSRDDYDFLVSGLVQRPEVFLDPLGWQYLLED